MRYLKLYWNFLKNCIKREILYRFNFFVNILLSRILSGPKPSHIQSNKKEARHKLF